MLLGAYSSLELERNNLQTNTALDHLPTMHISIEGEAVKHVINFGSDDQFILFRLKVIIE